MKALLLSLIITGSFQALADQAIEAAPCLDLSTIAVHVNKLVITKDDEIFWDGKPVFLSLNDESKKNGFAAFRLLFYLAKHPYKRISAEELHKFAWGGRPSRDVKEIVGDGMRTVRAGFLRVDENFKALKTIWHYGFIWDDGMTASSKYNFPDVPELAVTESEMHWNGKLVKLTPPQRAMVLYLLKYRGNTIPVSILYQIFKKEHPDTTTHLDMSYTMRQQFYLIRDAFRDVDENFDRIQNDGHKFKLWVVEKDTPSAQAAE